MEALGHRQFDLYSLSDAEWRRMSRRQQAELLKHQNRSQQIDHSLGQSYLPSPALERAVRRAHDMYLVMRPEQRRTVLHPRHLDQWLDDRRAVTIIASDLETTEPLPEYLLPPSYAIPDEGRLSARASLTIASGAGRRPASQVRNVSSATPRAVAHSAWERPRRVRISLRAEAWLAIGHDDAIGAPLLKANGGRSESAVHGARKMGQKLRKVFQLVGSDQSW
jgi:hypothetical protein